MNKLMLISLCLIVLVSGGCSSSPSAPTTANTFTTNKPIAPTTVNPTTITSATSAIEISAVDLYAAYEANEVGADLKYKGKNLRVTGVITDISTDLLGYPTVSFGMDSYNISKVKATFNKSEASNVANLQKGQTITVNGTGDGKFMYVDLKNCTVVNTSGTIKPATSVVANPALTTSATSVIEISAVDLYTAYEFNEVGADLKYKGKYLQVTGVITDISTDLLGYPKVSFGMDAYNMSGIEATFNKSEASNLANLQKGQTLTINGTGDGKWMYVDLKNCTIAK